MRQEILNTLRTKLLTIKKIDGYNNDLVKVHRLIKELSQISDNDCPSAHIVSMGERDVRGESLTQCIWTLGIIFYLSAYTDTSEEGLLEKAVEDLIEDAQVLFDTNLSMPAGVSQADIVGVEPYLDTVENKAVIFLTIQITYYRGE